MTDESSGENPDMLGKACVLMHCTALHIAQFHYTVPECVEERVGLFSGRLLNLEGMPASRATSIVQLLM